MIRYVGYGSRDYAARPVPVYRRAAWEFQAVLSGACAPRLPDDRVVGPGILAERSLWVFPPELPHGWCGRRGWRCEVAVFHFSEVPELLAGTARKTRFLQVDVDADDSDRLRRMARDAAEHLRAPHPLDPLHFGLLLHEICLLVLGKLPLRGLAAAADHDPGLVESARAWFAEHLSESPGMRDVAAAVNCSPSHLRRLFVKVLGRPPREVLEQLRLERAREMLLLRFNPLKEIARACGYESQSCFSRAFKSALGLAPRDWRERQAPPGVNPGGFGRT